MNFRPIAPETEHSTYRLKFNLFILSFEAQLNGPSGAGPSEACYRYGPIQKIKELSIGVHRYSTWFLLNMARSSSNLLQWDTMQIVTHDIATGSLKWVDRIICSMNLSPSLRVHLPILLTEPCSDSKERVNNFLSGKDNISSYYAYSGKTCNVESNMISTGKSEIQTRTILPKKRSISSMGNDVPFNNQETSTFPNITDSSDI